MSASIEIDPTFVLKHLNDLGYRNITADQLREFVRDLKKLIKYDKTKATSQQPPHVNFEPAKHYVYMRETESSRAKRSNSTTNSVAPSTSDRLTTTTTACSKSTTALDKQTQQTHSSGEEMTDSANYDHHMPRSRRRRRSEGPDSASTKDKNTMWIRPKSGTRRTKKSDPVSMYQAYQNDWTRFKDQIPIDNKHLELRWNIRKKTLG